MNVFGKTERSWRKARKRAVSPIIATILLVAITVVLAAVLYVLISGLTHGPSSAPLGTDYSWGSPNNATASSPSPCAAGNGITITAKYCYTIQIAGAGGGVSTSSVSLALRGSSGATVAWPAATVAQVSVLSPTVSGDVATYNVATGAWTLVGTFSGVFASGMTFVVGVASGATATWGQGGLLGISIEAVGSSGFSGVVTSSAFS
jgi:archaeal type IV pilus assembly protein PilA